jgi:hypothetical protein
MDTNSAKPPAMTSFEEPIALRPADRAKGTVSPSLRPYKSARPKYRASSSIVRKKAMKALDRPEGQENRRKVMNLRERKQILQNGDKSGESGEREGFVPG